MKAEIKSLVKFIELRNFMRCATRNIRRRPVTGRDKAHFVVFVTTQKFNNIPISLDYHSWTEWFNLGLYDKPTDGDRTEKWYEFSSFLQKL